VKGEGDNQVLASATLLWGLAGIGLHCGVFRDLAPSRGLRARRRQNLAQRSSQEFAEHITGPLRFRIRGGIRSVSHGITAKHGISETSGTTVNVVEPI
jgi:hypothetical protein